MSEANRALVQRAVDAFNQGDWAAVDDLVAGDYIDHDPPRARRYLALCADRPTLAQPLPTARAGVHTDSTEYH